MNKNTFNNKLLHSKRKFYSIMKSELGVNPYAIKIHILVREFCKNRNMKYPSRKYLSKWFVDLWEDESFTEIGKLKGQRNYSTNQLKKHKNTLVLKYGCSCMKCGSVENIAVDHIKPYSKFPELSLDINNLQLLCKSCNSQKSNKKHTDYRPFI